MAGLIRYKSFHLLFVISLAIGLLGLTVIAGWILHNPALIQLNPSWVPMQFNTALGFVLTSLATLACLFRRDRLALLAAGLLAFLVSLTLVEYLMKMDLGMDQLFMSAYLTVKTTHPGRMAPNTAFAFLLTSITLVYLALSPARRFWDFIVVDLLATVIGVVAVAAFLSYFIHGVGNYAWGHYTLMALHTSLGFMLISALLAVVVLQRMQGMFPKLRYRPMFLSWLVIASISLILWFALERREHHNLEAGVQLRTAQIGQLLHTGFVERSSALKRMAERWRVNEQMNMEYWPQDAKSYLRDFPGFNAIEWVNEGLRVVRVEPLQGNEAVIGLDLSFESRRRNALQRALVQNTQTVSRNVELVQGGKGILVFTPLRNRETLIGVFIIAHLVEKTIDEAFFDDFDLRITEGGELIYQDNDPSNDLGSGYVGRAEVELSPNNVWYFIASPTARYLAEKVSVLPLFVLLVGFVLATVASVILFYQQMLQSQSRVQADTNRLLRVEIEQREAAQRAKDDFFSMVSHELRTPLTAISGSVGLLLAGVDGAKQGKTLELLTMADKNSRRLAEMINDLLDINKIAAGKMEFDPDIYPVMPLVDQVIEMNASYAHLYDVKLTVSQRLDSAQIRVDAKRFQQVLTNLLSNAIKFSPGGGRVLITVGQVEDKVRISVVDQGKGIANEFRPHLFKAFSQADLSSSRRAGGTGLGLYISKSFVDLMGGTIGFVSQPDRGATFYVEFPVCKQPADAKSSNVIEEKMES